MRKFTHKELVDIAFEWAKSRHGVVVKEFHCYTNDMPDVFAFASDFSTMIECKTSRSDFLVDKKKTYRWSDGEYGMSNYRIYCTPKGLLNLDKDIPEKWGLLEVGDNGNARLAVDIFKGQNSIFWYESNTYMAKQERKILYSIARRATIKGLITEICKPLPVLDRTLG